MASALLIYLAKTVGISAVLWVYYIWFLRDERFHQYNRLSVRRVCAFPGTAPDSLALVGY